jgi:molecular chaperone Hsp33
VDSVEREALLGRSEDFSRIAILAKSLKREEMLTLDAETILHRLFWEEPLARFEPLLGESGPRFACSCSRERVGNMIRSLGAAEAESIIAEQGQIEVGCDFCGAQYRFDPVDAAGLFVAPVAAPGDPSVH